MNTHLRNLITRMMPSMRRRAMSRRVGESSFNISVEGNIGAGKTSFLNTVSELSDPSVVEIVPEPVEEWQDFRGKYKVLDLMYEDPKKWGFLFQTLVQLTILKKTSAPSEKPVRFMERSLLSARFCFIENLRQNGFLKDIEVDVLDEWFNFLTSDARFRCKVDLIVYLRTSPQIARERMIQRNRSQNEVNLDLEHFEKIHDLHENWLYHKTMFQPLPCPVVVVNADKDLADVRNQYKSLENLFLQNAV